MDIPKAWTAVLAASPLFCLELVGGCKVQVRKSFPRGLPLTRFHCSMNYNVATWLEPLPRLCRSGGLIFQNLAKTPLIRVSHFDLGSWRYVWGLSPPKPPVAMGMHVSLTCTSKWCDADRSWHLEESKRAIIMKQNWMDDIVFWFDVLFQ